MIVFTIVIINGFYQSMSSLHFLVSFPSVFIYLFFYRGLKFSHWWSFTSLVRFILSYFIFLKLLWLTYQMCLWSSSLYVRWWYIEKLLISESCFCTLPHCRICLSIWEVFLLEFWGSLMYSISFYGLYFLWCLGWIFCSYL